MNLRVKQVLVFSLAAVVTVSTLSGCASSGSHANSKSAGNENQAKHQGTSLKFWRAGTDVETDAYWKEMINRFQAKNPNVKVELSSLPWGDEIETKLNAAYASGTAPDVLQYSAVSIPQRASVGQYASLDSYIDNWEGKKDMFPSVMKSGKYKGKTYGLGMRPDARMFVWRKDMFKKAGLDPETPPTTWEELKKYADKLTIKKNGTTVQAGYNLPMANGFQDFQIFLMQNGGDFIDVKTGKLTYNSPEAVEALNFLHGLIKSGDVIPADQFQSGNDVFISGKAAMAYKNPSDIRGMIAANPSMKEKIGMSAPLKRKKQATFAGMGFMFMSSDSKNKDLSWKFIDMAMSAQEMRKRTDVLGIPPVRESLKKDYIAKDPAMNKAIMDSIAVGRGAYPVVFSNELNEKVSRAIEKVYYGKATTKKALDESVKAYQAEINAMK